ncbi:hypothetical protein H2201_003515 [Coniosporium apollinis]|uniref:Importin N-terminal domain-containing protein n=1 Tax=Coniosporium apollinis TaxID=61459 RepID=A0ABQ9NW57_9PEZI|nr:hypothetical protein H2201_003515 [Coniosporium apollinis]
MEVEGTIELPAEANPLTEGILYHVLRSAASNDPQQIQTGTKQLQKWETEKGFYSLLQSVFLDKSLPLEVRYLSIIQLKNGIDKYWRKTATNAVSKEEKEIIRSRLLDAGKDEADHRLALQNALVIAKIVRFEFPNDWPDVFTKLIEILHTSTSPNANRLNLPRTLLILLHIVKELATGRLIRTRANLQSVTPELLHAVASIYVSKVQTWQAFMQGGGDDEGGALEAIEQSLLAIKVLRRLVIAGYEHPNREKDVQELWALSQSQLSDFLGLISQEQQETLSPKVRQLIEKHLMQLAKLHLEMARTHPAAFVLLPNSVDLVRSYWSIITRFGETFNSKAPNADAKIVSNGDAVDEETSVQERLTLKGLLTIRACIKMVFNPTQTFKYRHPEEKEEKAQAAEILKTQLFVDSFVIEMMEVTVSRFFVFRPSDLRQWEEEPEEWEVREEGEGDSFEFSVRPCAEKLFMDLAINYKDLVVQPLLNVFYSVASPDVDNVLFKDSVYTAIGLAAAVLHQQLDFDAFLSSTLVPEVQKQQPGYNILRRRIAILLGQWITIKVSEQSRPLVYQIFQHLLDKNDPLNDQVVRVTAGKQFKNIADDWEFRVEQFMPFADETLARLMALIEEVELTETKMALLNTISVVVERLEHHITPFASRIVSLLPPLWEQSGSEHLMKQAILTILSRLINAMKSESRPFHSMVLPIIKGAVEPGSETQLYLLDDALDLWHAILCQTVSNDEAAKAELLALAPHLLHTLSLGTDTLRKALEIAESYILLAPQALLADASFRSSLLTQLAELLGTLRPDANGLLTHLVEIFVRASEGVGGQEGVRVVVGDMVATGFFAKLVTGLREAWEAHQTTGPKRKDSPIDGIVETDYFSVVARIAFSSPSLLLQALSALSSPPDPTVGTEGGVEATMKWLLEEWFSHLENIGDPGRRKLMSLALTKLLDTNAPWILGRLQELMSLWTDVVTELMEGGDDKHVDSLVYGPMPTTTTTAHGDPESPEDLRRRELVYSDPIHTVNLMQFIRTQLQRAIQAQGGQQGIREWVANVDQDVLKAFGALRIL